MTFTDYLESYSPGGEFFDLHVPLFIQVNHHLGESISYVHGHDSFGWIYLILKVWK